MPPSRWVLLTVLFVACALLLARELLIDSDSSPPRPNPAPRLETVWTFKGELPVWKSFVANGTLFVLDSEYVHALDPVTGREKWRRENTNYELEKSLSADRLYKRDYRNGRLEWCAVSLESGEEIGRFPAQPSPTVFFDSLEGTFGETLVFVDREKGLYGVERETGHIKWTHSTRNTSVHFQAFDGILYCSTVDGFLRAIDPETGKTLWKTPNTTDCDFVLDAKVLYFLDLNDDIFGIDRLTGKRLWKFTPDDFHSRPVPSGESVFTIMGNSYLACIDPRTGQLKWREDMISNVEKIVPLGSVVYASGSNGEVYACHAESGVKLVVPKAGFPVRRIQAASGRLLYVLGRDDRLYAVRAKAQYTYGQEVQ